MLITDWSSDVCSPDLCLRLLFRALLGEQAEAVAERSVAALTVRLPGMERPTRALPDRIAPAALLDRVLVHALEVVPGQVVLAHMLQAEPEVAGEVVARARRPVQRSEEHTSELQSLMRISYAVFCLKKKTQ